jgi:L-gulonolactone oxidase
VPAQLRIHIRAGAEIGHVRGCRPLANAARAQTLAGVVATATHGSGIGFPVLSSHVFALELMLPDGSVVHCSRDENEELFMASLCGLGATGLILTITMEVEPAFRLKEYQQTVSFETAIQRLPELAPSAEHVRMWWFPQVDSVRLSMSNRTTEVCHRN